MVQEARKESRPALLGRKAPRMCEKIRHRERRDPCETPGSLARRRSGSNRNLEEAFACGLRGPLREALCGGRAPSDDKNAPSRRPTRLPRSERSRSRGSAGAQDTIHADEWRPGGRSAPLVLQPAACRGLVGDTERQRGAHRRRISRGSRRDGEVLTPARLRPLRGSVRPGRGRARGSRPRRSSAVPARCLRGAGAGSRPPRSASAPRR